MTDTDADTDADTDSAATLERTIVVADDEPGYCESIKDLLEDEGYRVEIAADGQAALEILRRLPGQPCLLLLDLIMPILDGGDVYREVKADPRLAPIPVVIATSDPTRAPTGAMVMRKPVKLERLLEVVRRACSAT
ncbi:MAG TPA: response regulator [Kofleriaceae bacterium]|nr:response regulator [Kofleriaceae bacterium]